MVTKEQKKKKVENRQPSIPAGGPKDQFGKTASDGDWSGLVEIRSSI